MAAVTLAVNRGVVRGVAAEPSWIDPRQLADREVLPRVLDVRSPGEYFRGPSRLPGSELVPLPDLLFCCTNWDPEQPLLLVCDVGERSWRGACELAQRGFGHVSVLRGGLEGLERHGPAHLRRLARL